MKGRDYERATYIADVVCRQLGIDKVDFHSPSRSCLRNISRGIFCLLCLMDKELIRSSVVAEILGCSRSNAVNVTRHYKGYYDIKDKVIMDGYNKAVMGLGEV